VLYRVYVDEAGDLGISPRASRHLVLSAVVVADAEDAALRSDLHRLRLRLGRRPSHALHFVRLDHSKRLKAAQDMAASHIWAIVSVALRKDSIDLSDLVAPPCARPFMAYLWALRVLLERLSSCFLEVRESRAIVTLSQLKGFEAQLLRNYRAALEASGASDVSWTVFDGHPFRIDQPTKIELLQCADITASALFRAVEPDPFGNVERRYFEELGPKLHGPVDLPVERDLVASP